MNSILDNELVRKYFGNDWTNYEKQYFEKVIAERVLISMQQPIRKGDKIMLLPFFPITEADESIEGFHHWCLRLPDAFQKQEKKCAWSAGDKWEHTPNYCGGMAPAPSPEKWFCRQFQGMCSEDQCKPKDAAKKCEHRNQVNYCNYCHSDLKPKKAVEDKIDEIEVKLWTLLACRGEHSTNQNTRDRPQI